MKKKDLVKLLNQLPDDADVYIGNFLGDGPVGVDRVILNRDCVGEGGKIIAGVIRCAHSDKG